MHDFGVAAVGWLCHVLNVAPEIITKVGEGVVIVGKAVSSVLCGAPPAP